MEVDELEQRLSDQECYTSTDCVIAKNVHFSRDGTYLDSQVSKFLKDFCFFYVACHLLTKERDNFFCSSKNSPICIIL